MNRLQILLMEKRLYGNPIEIKEVKNAYEVYEQMQKLNEYTIKDFLFAHSILAKDLIENSGRFRDGDIGVYNGENMIHMGANPKFVPTLIKDVFDWAKESEIHPLIKSSIVHYEIEFIHPFQDGNGRIGRLWQTLILTKWNEFLAWIPIETMIYNYQQEYYEALSKSGSQRRIYYIY